MVPSQQSSLPDSSGFARLSVRGRLIAAAVFVVIAGGFAVVNWGERTGSIRWDRVFDPCGFKQRTRLPCPTCGMTTAVRAFAVGHVWQAFYTQPAAGLLCVVLVGVGLGSLFMAVTGRDAGLLAWVRGWRWYYIVMVVVVAVLAAWAVTLARAVS
jgi:hypothetical protein